MNSENDNHGILFLGGALAVIVIGMMVMKAVNQFLIELSSAMNSFGKMMGSFIPMLWNTFEVVALIAMILFVIVGGIYFAYRYFQAVKEVTDNREWLALRLAEAASDTEARASGIEQKIHARVDSVARYMGRLDEQLTEALKKPKVVPPKAEDVPPATESVNPEPAPVVEVTSSNPF